MGRLTSKPISFKTNSVERVSGHGFNLGCPICMAALMLKDTRDGDQAYWCHACNRGWRAGHLPPEARRAKAKALLETSLETTLVPEVVIQVPPLRTRVSKPTKTLLLEPAKKRSSPPRATQPQEPQSSLFAESG